MEKKLLAGKMKVVVAFVLCVSVASCAVLQFDDYKEQWQAWKTFHGKQYETDTQEAARYAIWRDNLRVCKLKMLHKFSAWEINCGF